MDGAGHRRTVRRIVIFGPQVCFQLYDAESGPAQFHSSETLALALKGDRDWPIEARPLLDRVLEKRTSLRRPLTTRLRPAQCLLAGSLSGPE
jgi:hypothetical protein